jgi:hypothetical protein
VTIITDLGLFTRWFENRWELKKLREPDLNRRPRGYGWGVLQSPVAVGEITPAIVAGVAAAIGYNFGDNPPVCWVQAELGPNELQLTLLAIGGNRSGHNQSQTLSWQT